MSSDEKNGVEPEIDYIRIEEGCGGSKPRQENAFFRRMEGRKAWVRVFFWRMEEEKRWVKHLMLFMAFMLFAILCYWFKVLEIYVVSLVCQAFFVLLYLKWRVVVGNLFNDPQSREQQANFHRLLDLAIYSVGVGLGAYGLVVCIGWAYPYGNWVAGPGEGDRALKRWSC